MDEFFKGLSKKQLAEMLSDSWKNKSKLTKWLYDNHKKVLREWEATQGDLRVEFLSSDKK